MNHSVNHGRLRLGRMVKWQKWSSYIVFSLCVVTGLMWFLLGDVYHWMPPQLKIWWLSHGLTSLVSLMLIGAPLPQHVSITWRAKRNRGGGGLSMAFLILLLGSVGFLYYGSADIHEEVRVFHITIGLVLLAAFPWHIIRGRRSASILQNITQPISR